MIIYDFDLKGIGESINYINEECNKRRDLVDCDNIVIDDLEGLTIKTVLSVQNLIAGNYFLKNKDFVGLQDIEFFHADDFQGMNDFSNIAAQDQLIIFSLDACISFADCIKQLHTIQVVPSSFLGGGKDCSSDDYYKTLDEAIRSAEFQFHNSEYKDNNLQCKITKSTYEINNPIYDGKRYDARMIQRYRTPFFNVKHPCDFCFYINFCKMPISSFPTYDFSLSIEDKEINEGELIKIGNGSADIEKNVDGSTYCSDLKKIDCDWPLNKVSNNDEDKGAIEKKFYIIVDYAKYLK